MPDQGAKTRLRVLMVTHHRFNKSFARPGPIAEYLARRGHQVTLITTADSNRARWKENLLKGVRVVEAPDMLWGRLRSGWDPWGTLLKTWMLRKELPDYDVVHLFETRPSVILPYRFNRGRSPAPLIIDWNDWWAGKGGIIDLIRPRWYKYTFGRLEAWFEAYYRDSADGTTAISTALVRRALEMGVDPEAVIQLTGGTRPEVFPFQTIEECRAKVPFRLGNPVIGFASLDSHLDMELVLDALGIVARQYPDVSLLVTGRPSASLRNMGTARGIGDRLVMSGLVPFEELSTYLGCADVCVLPLWDTTYNRGRWPNKITDYTTAGRPMVTNAVGDIEALVRQHEIGLLAGWTPDEFAGAIRDLLDNPEKAVRLGQNARRLAEGELSWARRAEELELFYYARIAAKQSALVQS